jgi:hypothetical protein
MKTIVLISVWLGLCQFGSAGTLTLPCENSFVTTGGNFGCTDGSASIANGFASVVALNTIPLPPPNNPGMWFPSNTTWSSTLLLDFTSGPVGLQGGYFLPCLHSANFNGVADANFGPVQNNATFDGSRSTCSGSPADFSAANDISFTFGVTQTFALALGAFAPGGITMGNASANFSSFEVFDSAGDNITSEVTFTLVDVDSPEPGTFLPLGGGLLICCVINRLKRA